jgi:hypothetical protein
MTMILNVAIAVIIMHLVQISLPVHANFDDKKYGSQWMTTLLTKKK